MDNAVGAWLQILAEWDMPPRTRRVALALLANCDVDGLIQPDILQSNCIDRLRLSRDDFDAALAELVEAAFVAVEGDAVRLTLSPDVCLQFEEIVAAWENNYAWRSRQMPDAADVATGTPAAPPARKLH